MNDEYQTNREIMALLAERVKRYRLWARLSQREMAERSGVSVSTVCHFEQGVALNITLNNFISLLRQVGMEGRLVDVLPELPPPPEVIRFSERHKRKRVRRKRGED